MKINTKIKAGRFILTIVVVMVALLATPYVFSNNVYAFKQQTCPQTGDWVKVDGINSQSYNYSAPAGKVVVQTCYKAGTTLRFETVAPPKASVTLTSDVPNPTHNAFQDISHASFKLADDEKEEDLNPLSLSGQCQGDGTYLWTVSNPNNVSINFSWQTTNSESGSAVVSGNSFKTFSTTSAGNNLTLFYTINDTSKQINKVLAVCEEPKEDLTPLSLSGECQGDGTYLWAVTNPNDTSINFSWQTTNSESGSGEVSGNSFKTFFTTSAGNNLTLSYTINETPTQINKVVAACEEPKSDPDPLALSGECQGDGTILWTVNNPNSFSVSFAWQTTNSESGSSEVSGNSFKTFFTTSAGNSLTVSYTINDAPRQVSKALDVCEDPKVDPDQLILFGECQGDGSILWTVTNPNDTTINFAWKTANNESGSSEVAGNSFTMFSTTSAGNDLTLTYSINDGIVELGKAVEVCDDSKEEPKESVDPAPDVAAGGNGPSLVASVTPFLLGFSGLGAITTLIFKSKKESENTK